MGMECTVREGEVKQVTRMEATGTCMCSLISRVCLEECVHPTLGHASLFPSRPQTQMGQYFLDLIHS